VEWRVEFVAGGRRSKVLRGYYETSIDQLFGIYFLVWRVLVRILVRTRRRALAEVGETRPGIDRPDRPFGLGFDFETLHTA
jgi:hypothetical protein